MSTYSDDITSLPDEEKKDDAASRKKEFAEIFRDSIGEVSDNPQLKENAEYIQLSSFQKFCRKNGYRCSEFVAMARGLIPPKDKIEMELSDMMRMVEVIRKDKGISKGQILRAIDMSEPNFMKLYRQGKSINMMTLFSITDALGTPLDEFLRRVEDELLEQEKAKTSDKA